MRIIITRANIDSYRDRTFNTITKLDWRAGSLDTRILGSFPNLQVLHCCDNNLTSLAGLEACPQLLELNCNNNKLTSLAPVGSCPNLIVLKCRTNKLTDLTMDQVHSSIRVLDCANNSIAGMVGIECFPMLRDLDCSNNQLLSLIRTEACTLLKRLHCSHNRIHAASAIGSHPQLRELICYGNNLASLAGLSCKELRSLNCGSNSLMSLAGIESCPELVVLHCRFNKLASLAGLESCPLLKQLGCGYNSIRALTGLAYCPLLEELCCSQNHLETLTEISASPLLKRLYCSGNLIGSLVGIEAWSLLEELYCFDNRLQSLEGLGFCLRLRRLVCIYNGLTLLRESNHIRQAISLVHVEIEIDQRRMWTGNIHHAWANNNPRVCLNLARAAVRPRGQQTIYDDRQNVHDAHIHETVIESMRNLLKDPKPAFTLSMIVGSGLSTDVIRLLVQFCSDTTRHSAHKITYQELLGYVWARITKSMHRPELLRILEEQVLEAVDKCMTGKFTRTLSVLVGFYEDIMIEISDSSRIGAIILAVRDRVWPCEVSELREKARAALIDAGYEEGMIEPWLGAIV